MPHVASFDRARVVGIARRWIGTPYHHQASVEGAGVDCIGLVRGIWRELLGAEPEPLPGYSRDWAEATGDETLLAAARRHFVEVAPDRARPGDVLVFRYRLRSIAKHAGLLAAATPGAETFIHAVEGAPVTEVPLGAWWRRRIAAAFTFPGIID
ncbi:MAG: C40 family peptidase [Proteobacteria bacterium]|nr:C40 family peptidase [Pseudomonadota bacterium]